MILTRQIVLAAACAAVIAPGWAADPKDSQDHDVHHPAGAVSTPVASTPASVAFPSAVLMTRMEEHMKQMQALHDNMARTKTSAQRQTLMDEHMKLMQEGMAMMNQMGGIGMSGMDQTSIGLATPADMVSRQQMLEKRMDMMQSMMQMMMDRMQSPMAPTAK